MAQLVLSNEIHFGAAFLINRFNDDCVINAMNMKTLFVCDPTICWFYVFYRYSTILERW